MQRRNLALRRPLEHYDEHLYYDGTGLDTFLEWASDEWSAECCSHASSQRQNRFWRRNRFRHANSHRPCESDRVEKEHALKTLLGPLRE